MLNLKGENVDELCVNNYSLLPYFVRKYCSKYSNDEILEIIDYCLIAYIKSCINYNTDLSIEFSTYVGNSIKNKIAEYFSRYRYKPQNNCVSLDQIINTEYENITLLETIEDKKCKHSFLLESVKNYIKTNFTVHEKELFIDYLNGIKQRELSIKYNISQPYVSRKINKLTNEIKNNTSLKEF